jgi:hypothetical protein
MDAKITKKRLARLLSYDWIKIIAFAVAAILFWSLIFTMTATKITPSQQFTVFNYYSNGSLSNGFYTEYNKIFANDTFSYEVIETNVNDLAASGKEYAGTLLEARLGTDEGDVMFIPNTPDESTRTEDENGVVSYSATHMQTFFKGWFPYVWNVDAYLTQMQAYVDGYKNADGTFDQAKIKNDFLTRVRKNKDKRFRKDEQLQAGIEAEYARIQKYDEALKEFHGYVESGLIEYVEMELVIDDGTVYREKANYAINLCPDVNTMGGLKKHAYYNTTAEDGSPLPTAKDMCVMLFRLQGVESTFEYESLLYVNAVIKSAIAETQKQA